MKIKNKSTTRSVLKSALIKKSIINSDQIHHKINKILYEDNTSEMGKRSLDIIREWTFENSRKSLEEIIAQL